MTNFFASNRDQLTTKLKGGIVVLTAHTGMQRNNDTAFRFEQEANFWWLTGIEVPDWWLIIDGVRRKSWLVAPTISKIHEVFDGSLSPEEAQKISGADEVIGRDEAKQLLRDLAKKHSVAYALGEEPYVEYYNFSINPAGRKLHEMLERTFNAVQDCRKDLAKLRAIKQPEEITRIKKAIGITIDGMERVRENLAGFSYEYEVEAELTHAFRKAGAQGHSFDPIVSSGKNTCTLHYLENNEKLKKKTLLLMDIGVRYKGYATDIARTYALGEPTKRQRDVHAAVQQAQAEIIQLLLPELSVEQYQRSVDEIMAKALMSLGLMKDAGDEEAYHKYFPHAIGHGLGVDVHESLGAPRSLQPGMLLTVEPGIYIPEEGIGVRIEDDILITDKGRTNLSARLSTDL
jgi:Xaa-Pro aminopeptidase